MSDTRLSRRLRQSAKPGIGKANCPDIIRGLLAGDFLVIAFELADALLSRVVCENSSSCRGRNLETALFAQAAQDANDLFRIVHDQDLVARLEHRLDPRPAI